MVQAWALPSLTLPPITRNPRPQQPQGESWQYHGQGVVGGNPFDNSDSVSGGHLGGLTVAG